MTQAAEALIRETYERQCELRRSGSSYVQGDLGTVRVTSTDEGGVYLGASSRYPGSVSSVDADMSGTGNVVVATSNGEFIRSVRG